MKNILLVIVVAIGFPILGRAQNLLKLMNNTNHDVWTAYALYDGKCWVCKGWYKIDRFNTITLNLGDYSGQIFIHGENRSAGYERNWGDNDMLCVEECEAFSIRCPRNVDCLVKKMFSLITANMDGMTKFTFNP